MYISHFLFLIIIFSLLAADPEAIFTTPPSVSDLFFSELLRCFCVSAYLLPAAPDLSSTSHLFYSLNLLLHPTTHVFSISMNLSCSPYLSSSALLVEPSSSQMLLKIHIMFDKIELSSIINIVTALISSRTLTKSSPLSAQFIVICLISSSKH